MQRQHSFTAPWHWVAAKLDATGMYRVVTLGLLFLTLCSVSFGFLGLVAAATGLEQLLSLMVIVAVSLLSNIVLASLWGVHANHESALITALILFFLLAPPPLAFWVENLIGAGAALLAMLSKYVIAYRGQHILNPAAAGAAGVAAVYGAGELLGYTIPPGFFESSWWIGTPVLFVPLLIVGSLVVSKVRKWVPALSFLGAAFVVFMVEKWWLGEATTAAIPEFFISGPSLFLAFFMLTEPFTMPPRTTLQGYYGVVVGALSQTLLFQPIVKMTPELALLIGNVIFWPFTLRQKLILPLISKSVIAEDTYEFVFEKPAGLSFLAGQYLEWMLPHESVDSRGERRYFTIASSPTESTVKLGLKVVQNGSSYKSALLALDEGDEIIASQLAGDFVLPADPTVKLGFIAGGIGVTPFRSHIQYMVDSGQTHDTTLFYCSNTVAELAYTDVFAAAAEHYPLAVVPVIAKEDVGDEYETGFIDADMLARRCPDYQERHWYLSGPPPMVNAYESLLKRAGVPARHIITDFFPGLA